MRTNYSSIVAGVDIGGSHITVALVDLERKNLITQTSTRLRIDANAPAEKIISLWSEAIRKAHGDLPLGKIGIAMPGPCEYEKGISLIKNQDKYDALYALNIKHLLAQSLSIDPENICFANDAACFILGEAFAGAAKHSDKAIGITLGTGLGSASYHHGKAQSLDLWNTPFKNSIAEDYLSTRWFVKRYFEKTGNHITGVKDLTLLAGKHQLVQEIFEEFSENLHLFLCQLIEQESPEAVIFGGNIAKAYHLFEKAIINTKQKYSFVCLEKTGLGENASILGAASLWQTADRHIV